MSHDYWDGVRTGENDGEEPWHRVWCPSGDRCLSGCRRIDQCYTVRRSPGEMEYASWAVVAPLATEAKPHD